jgi:hypothetical protein
VSSSSDSESEECVNLALMDSHHSDDEEEEVSNETSSHNETLGAIDELLNECEILYKTVPTQKKQILSLEEKIDTMKKYFEVEKQKLC